MSDPAIMEPVVHSVDLITPWIVDDIRPLVAFLAPWIGMIGIMWAGEKRPNLRETFTFIAAIVQATVVNFSGRYSTSTWSFFVPTTISVHIR